MLKNKQFRTSFTEKMIAITKPIKEIIMSEKKIGNISKLKKIKTAAPLHFVFGFSFYNYYDVLFDYKNERLTWKAISCKKDEEEITNNKLYNPMESQEIVNDIETT